MEQTKNDSNGPIDVSSGNVEPRSTSRYIGKEERAIPRDKLIEYFIQQTGMTIEDYMIGKVWDQACVAVGALMEPDVLGYFQVGLEIYALLSSIEDAMTAIDLGTAIVNMPSGARYFVAISNNYEWLSGSGNHTGYYSEMTYLYRN